MVSYLGIGRVCNDRAVGAIRKNLNGVSSEVAAVEVDIVESNLGGKDMNHSKMGLLLYLWLNIILVVYKHFIRSFFVQP